MRALVGLGKADDDAGRGGRAGQCASKGVIVENAKSCEGCEVVGRMFVPKIPQGRAHVLSLNPDNVWPTW